MSYIEQENLCNGSLSEEEYNNYGFDERQAYMTVEVYAAETFKDSIELAEGACQ